MHITDTHFCNEKGTGYAFVTNGDALDVLTGMYKILDNYGCVTVVDLLKLLGRIYEITGSEIYGWTSLDDMVLSRVSTTNGTEWHITIPAAKFISNTPQFRERFSIKSKPEYERGMNVTVRDLKDCLKDLPDDMEVIVPVFDDIDNNKISGFRTKHLTALRDMVMKNDFSNREDFLEKCQDTINYIRFLWCIGNDEIDSEMKEKAVAKETETEEPSYYKCPYIQHFREDEPGCTIIGIGHCKGNECSIFKNIKKESK